MDTNLGEGWADAVSKILRMGKKNPESNQILSKAKKDQSQSDGDSHSDDSEDDDRPKHRSKDNYNTVKLKPEPQADALLEKELKSIATRGVVHLFNAVKTVNPKSDKRKKKKKKKKTKKKLAKRRRI